MQRVHERGRHGHHQSGDADRDRCDPARDRHAAVRPDGPNRQYGDVQRHRHRQPDADRAMADLTNGGTSWGNIAGATATTYSLSTSAADLDDEFRAVFTNGVGSTSTNAATLTLADYNWSGYVLDQGTFTAVSGSWTVPTLTCSSDGRPTTRRTGLASTATRATRSSRMAPKPTAAAATRAMTPGMRCTATTRWMTATRSSCRPAATRSSRATRSTRRSASVAMSGRSRSATQPKAGSTALRSAGR